MCPLNGACLTANIVYEATVTTSGSTKRYIGSTGCDFKSRFNSHTYSFTHKREKETELSKHIWSLKENNTPHEMTWSSLKHIPGGAEPQKLAKPAMKKRKRLLWPQRETFSKNVQNWTVCVPTSRVATSNAYRKRKKSRRRGRKRRLERRAPLTSPPDHDAFCSFALSIIVVLIFNPMWRHKV